MSYNAVALGKLYGIAPNHVIHVGAWEGLDVPEYKELGAERITLIEALPDKAEALRALFDGDDQIEIVERAASNVTNEVVTFYPLNYGSSSLLKPKINSLKEIFSDFKESDAINVMTLKIDDLALPKLDSIMLVIDVQGAEMTVLEGATETLKRTALIKVEVSKTEYYEDPSRPSDIERFLKNHGFIKISERINNRIGQGDAIYARRGQIGLSQYVKGRISDARWKMSIQKINFHAVREFTKSFRNLLKR